MLHFITCSAGSRIYSNPLRIFYNGPVVWEVAVCVGVDMSFCKVPVNGRKVSDHDKVVQIAESR